MIFDKLLGARQLNRSITAARKLLSERGESNSVSMAHDVMGQFQELGETHRNGFYTALAENFNPDPVQVMAAAEAYSKDPSAANLVALTKSAEPPRQELLRRINRAPGGTQAILTMRRHILKILEKRPELLALDHDIRHLLSSWFNPGFLTMLRVDWRTPAHLLEKIIQQEAVHEIDGWDDLRRRLQPDRRCFAFFHAQLPEEPLIFVEVALLPEIPNSIAPLVDKKSPPLETGKFKVATFYSISNCEPGLRGVSLGNFLIKRVAAQLKAELPGLKTFVTLSPIPGFMDWVAAEGGITPSEKQPGLVKRYEEACRTLDLKGKSWAQRLAEGWQPLSASRKESDALTTLCALYLTQCSTRRGGNAVAKFHLGNGALLYRINWAADLSKKGLRESAGLMVNYLYDLDRVEENHERFVNGEVIQSRTVARLV
jgi:malonyl-CoA decarboxylase